MVKGFAVQWSVKADSVTVNPYPRSNIQHQLKKYPSHLFLQLDHDRLAGGRHDGKSLSETLENG